jgi:hypothetical protein
VNETGLSLSQINIATNTVVNTQAKVGVYPYWIAFAPTPSGPPVTCSYSLSAPSASFTANGGTGSVNVTAPAGCNWSVSNVPNWVSITSGASGSGNGTVNYTVAANGSSLQQSATLSIGGQNYSITESGVPCSFSLTSSSGNYGSAGGSGSAGVTAPAGCGWSASTTTSWITMVTSSGSGSGSATFTLASNPSSLSRTGTVTVAGQTYTVNQSGVACTFSLTSNSYTFPSTGGSSSVNVNTPAGCSWTASNSGAPWVTITGGSSGTGPGTVSFSAGANGGSSTLSGSLAIAGNTFTVSESGVACSYSLSGTTSFSATGGPGTVTVTAPSGCAWTAASNSNWLTVDPNTASGTGSGTVNFTAAANTTATIQNGSLTVAGQPFNVSESGVTCSVQLSANGANLPASGGSSSFNVTAPVGCNWTVSSDSPAWLNTTGTYTGTGNGTVNWAASANGSLTSVTGHLTVGGTGYSASYAVTEAGAAFSTIRVRCGGPNYTDSNSNVWQSDGSEQMSATMATIANAGATPGLYQMDAWSIAPSGLTYTYTVPNGSFTVTLKFAEYYVNQVGARTFNIVVNGTTQYSGFDILAHAGAMNTAYDVQIPVTVTNGQISIQLVPVTGAAKIDGIQID